MDNELNNDSPLAAPILPQPPKKRSRVWIVILVVFVIFAMLGSITIISVFNSLSNIAASSANLQGYTTKTLFGNDTKNRIAVIPLTGSIEGWGNAFQGEGVVHDICKQLRYALNDETVKAVLLHVDTPGGSVTASDTIYSEILSLQQSGKKVIVCVDDLCASGGYYVSASADYIVCHPTGMVGSFGVIMFRFELDGLLEKLGIKFDPVKSTASKDIGSPFRPLTEEEREYFKEILHSIHQRFVGIIAKGRKLEKTKVEELANGKIYLAQKALDYGLIDEVGYFAHAVKACNNIIKNDNAQFFEYNKNPTLMQQLGLQAEYQNTPLNKIINSATRYKMKAVMQGSINVE